ncbi:ankyrin repeats (3 copies) domain-containing protein [Pochonia chlamydosporia 170]|uniref:Ankyrin repeats (3 copies) domain-containing protein n=1 Tax=Pochonia chlamydosporia 170 TaxID=1380566 RepID=A0A179F0T8_METCM|nr:ankyrin repeats (3 copies) domain-containing protein [Pochonia chlamydosporia 170]OAQ59018.1 ankyrin repeats (3 copies) domain-containing protein [Pochonia chlamydosporia 170]
MSSRQSLGEADCRGYISTPKLPAELWLHIAEYLDESHINSLSQSSRGLHKALIWYLYTRNCRSSHTALLWAARNSVLPVIKVLLSVPCIDVNAKDHFNQTALSLAAQNGHTTAVSLLLTTPGIDVNSLDTYNRSALCHAAQNGFEPIVDALLQVRDIETNSGTVYEDTPLYLSIANGHEAITVKLLKTTNFGPIDGAGLAPLAQAAFLNQNVVVNKILEMNTVDADKSDHKSPNIAGKSQSYGRKGRAVLQFWASYHATQLRNQ